jgi:hypothetical protein
MQVLFSSPQPWSFGAQAIAFSLPMLGPSKPFLAIFTSQDNPSHTMI